MRQIDPRYYYKYSSISDPHFCTTCKIRDYSDSQLLNNINYSAWINYGMCQKCMNYFLDLQNGLLVDEQRINKLLFVLNNISQLKDSINQHLRFHLFPEDYDKLKILGYKQINIKNGDDQYIQRTCAKCWNVVKLDQNTYSKYKRCSKCNNEFKQNNFQWKGLEE